jgi:hypothetical protein
MESSSAPSEDFLVRLSTPEIKETPSKEGEPREHVKHGHRRERSDQGMKSPKSARSPKHVGEEATSSASVVKIPKNSGDYDEPTGILPQTPRLDGEEQYTRRIKGFFDFLSLPVTRYDPFLKRVGEEEGEGGGRRVEGWGKGAIVRGRTSSMIRKGMEGRDEEARKEDEGREEREGSLIFLTLILNFFRIHFYLRTLRLLRDFMHEAHCDKKDFTELVESVRNFQYFFLARGIVLARNSTRHFFWPKFYPAFVWPIFYRQIFGQKFYAVF